MLATPLLSAEANAQVTVNGDSFDSIEGPDLSPVHEATTPEDGEHARSYFFDDTSELHPTSTFCNDGFNESTDEPKVLFAEDDEGVLEDNTDEHLNGDGKGSRLGASINLANTILGAGVIGVPYAIRRSGFGAGIFLLVFVALSTVCTIRMLVALGKDTRQHGLEALCKHVYGRVGFVMISAAMFVFAYGAMCGYLVIIGDTAPVVLRHWTGSDAWYFDRRWVVCFVSLLIVLPLSLLRNMSSLAKTSSLSVLAVFVIVAAVVFRTSDKVGRLPVEHPPNEPPLSWVRPSVFGGVGTLAFAFTCQHSSFLIFRSLKKPRTLTKWAHVAYMAVGLAGVVTLAFGLIGYMSFWHETQGDLLHNFPAEDEVINVARVSLALAMIFTYPMELFVFREVLTSWLFEKGALHLTTTLQHVAITAAGFGASLFVALVVDDVGVVLEFFGSSAAAALAFIFPALLWLKVRGGKGMWRRFLNGSLPWQQRLYDLAQLCFCVFLLIFGSTVAVLGTTTAIKCYLDDDCGGTGGH